VISSDLGLFDPYSPIDKPESNTEEQKRSV